MYKSPGEGEGKTAAFDLAPFLALCFNEGINAGILGSF